YIVDGAKRLQQLIDDLLTYSRVGRGEVIMEPVAVHDIVQQVMHDLDRQIKAGECHVEIGELPVVHANRTLLRQVFQNLLSNATKFRGEAPLSIKIGAARTDGLWRFSVSDNGIGISPDARERIFMVFQRLHTRDEYPGTGIGLSVCKRIVERHGGSIWVEAEQKQGSTFYFTIPDRDEAPFVEIQAATAKERTS
ncbi:MAG TPA: ATP-binding protein, partial [Kiritimatiellia bacterium]